jgi:predicted Zn-dependent peptidase
MSKSSHTIIEITLILFLQIAIALGEKNQTEMELSVKPLPAGVSIYSQDNGIQVLLIENTGLPMTGVNVVVKTGSAYETFSTSGMSHMLEHLLFNGTESRTQKELYDAVDLIGGYNNANTGNYYTNFMMVTPADNIKKGMQIQADMLFRSIIPAEKFEKEKGIVLEEIASSLENPTSQMERNEQSILYPGHALSLATLGTYATIESMTRDDVYRYYQNFYVPNNMLMSVVGNFRSDSMRILINEIYGKEPPKPVQYPENTHWLSGFDRISETNILKEKVYHRFYRGQKLILQLFYDLPETWSDTHFIIVDEILLKANSVITDGLKTKYPDIEQSFKMETLQSPIKNNLKISMVVKDKNQLTGLTENVNQALKKLKFHLPAESIQYLATKTKTDFLKNVEKPHMFGIYNAHIFATEGIEAVLAHYSTRGYDLAGKEIGQFSINQKPLVIIQYPADKEDEKGVMCAIAPEVFIHKGSGLTLIAEQNPNSNLLAIHFLLKYKAAYESHFGKDAAKILHDCLDQRLNSTENQKISNKFGLTYKVNDNPFIPMDDIYLHPDFSYIRVEGLSDDIRGVIDYLKDQLTDFTPTEEEYQKAISKSKRPMTGMGTGKSITLFNETYKMLIYEEEKYVENTKLITYDTLATFAKIYFNPSNMIISVVSPAIPENIFDYFRWDVQKPEDFSDNERTPYTRALKPAMSPIKEEFKEGGERSFLFWGFVKTIESVDKAALKVLGLLLSDHIIFDVREKQGRAYRMKAGIDMDDNHALFYINMGTRPANIDQLLPQIPVFFDRTVVNSFKPFDLDKSLNMYLGRMMFRRLSSINKAYYLGHSKYFHDDIRYDAGFLSDLKTVTLDDIKRVGQKYMIVENPVTVIVR